MIIDPKFRIEMNIFENIKYKMRRILGMVLKQRLCFTVFQAHFSAEIKTINKFSKWASLSNLALS